MPQSPIHYAKLPGPGLSWSGWTRLWLAGDHLLEMNWTIFTERYHRFFLHEIRGVIAQRTNTGAGWSIALASLTLLGLAIAGGFYWGGTRVADDEMRVGLWIFAGIFSAITLLPIILLIFNILLGPTCRFYIQTGAGTRLLAAPTRLRRAERLLASLVPHIESVQSMPEIARPS